MNYLKLLNNYKSILFSVVFLTATLVFVNAALLKNVVYESDDYFLHATRIGNYYLALKQDQFPVRWGPNLNQSYGYPSFNYMYHTPYLFASFLHIVGFSIQQSLNLTVLTSLIFGSISCYFFVRLYSKFELLNIFLALFFVLNPYTLLSVYWRGAIGELFFYSFIPIFLTSIKLRKTLLVAISVTILILSHIPSLLLLSLFVTFYILSEKKLRTTQNLKILFIGTFLGLVMSTWYWIPAIFEQWMIKYQQGSSLTQFQNHFVSLTNLFDISKTATSSQNFLLVLNIGFVAALWFVVALFSARSNSKMIYWLTLFSISLFFTTTNSLVFWNKLQVLQYIQYPWRFMWLITLASIMIILTYFSSNQKKRWLTTIFLSLTAIGISFSAATYVHTKGSTSRSDFDWYHPVFDTGSSFNEHEPIWAKLPYYFPEELLYVSASQTAKLSESTQQQIVQPFSNLSPEIFEYNGTSISYQVNSDSEIIVLHKKIFFPGWEAVINSENTQFITTIPEYEGVLALRIPKGSNSVKIQFTGYTPLRRIAELVSVTSIFITATFYLLKKLKQKS